MLGGPAPCTRDPIHSASSGPPVQIFVATTAIAHTSPSRTRLPYARQPWPALRGRDSASCRAARAALRLVTPLLAGAWRKPRASRTRRGSIPSRAARSRTAISSSGAIEGPFDELEFAIDAQQRQQPLDLDGAAHQHQPAARPADAAIRRQDERRAAEVHELQRPQV